MSTAIKICQGEFGRVALLDMDASLVSHAHHHCHVLIKAAGSDTHFSVADGLQPLTTERAVLINSWESHSYEHPGDDAARCIILALYVEPRWLRAIRHPLGLGQHSQVFPQNSVPLQSSTRRLADQLIGDLWSGEDIAGQGLENLLFELMVSVIEPIPDWRDFAASRRLAAQRPGDPRIRRAIGFLREHIGASFEMDALAAECGLSRAHFFALFRRCTSVSPQVYFNVLRMEAAIDQLSHGRQLLCNIALETGFSAPSHFTRFFRQHLGIAPSEYRRVVDLYDGTRNPAH